MQSAKILVFGIGFAIGAISLGIATRLGTLLELARNGVAARGLVTSFDGQRRGRTEVKVLGSGSPFMIYPFCGGFECSPGSDVRVLYLPERRDTYYVGDDFGSQLAFSALVTFLIAPLVVGTGLLISLRKVSNWRKSSSRQDHHQVRFFRAIPLVMSGGMALSTWIAWARSVPMNRYQLAATGLALAGSISYVWVLKSTRVGRLTKAACWMAFLLSAGFAALDLLTG